MLTLWLLFIFLTSEISPSQSASLSGSQNSPSCFITSPQQHSVHLSIVIIMYTPPVNLNGTHKQTAYSREALTVWKTHQSRVKMAHFLQASMTGRLPSDAKLLHRIGISLAIKPLGAFTIKCMSVKSLLVLSLLTEHSIQQKLQFSLQISVLYPLVSLADS